MTGIFWTERERREIRDAARAAGVDEDEFAEFLHGHKEDLLRGPADNFTFSDLLRIAREFQKLRPKKSKPKPPR